MKITTKIAFCGYCRNKLEKNEIDFHKSCLDLVNKYINEMSDSLRIKFKCTALEADKDYIIVPTKNSQKPSEAKVLSIKFNSLTKNTDYIIYSNEDSNNE